MSHVKAINGTVVTYPYSMQQLQQDHPNTSFSPYTYTEPDTLKDFDVYKVEPVGFPEYDKINYKIVEGLPTLVDGTWYQTWNTVQCTPEEVTANIENVKLNLQTAVQNRLDSFAQTRNYDNILSCCTYATSTNSKFQQEAQYAIQARDSHWNTCYSILQQFEAGQRPIPTVDELLNEMPVLQWPN